MHTTTEEIVETCWNYIYIYYMYRNFNFEEYWSQETPHSNKSCAFHCKSLYWTLGVGFASAKICRFCPNGDAVVSTRCECLESSPFQESFNRNSYTGASCALSQGTAWLCSGFPPGKLHCVSRQRFGSCTFPTLAVKIDFGPILQYAAPCELHCVDRC